MSELNYSVWFTWWKASNFLFIGVLIVKEFLDYSVFVADVDIYRYLSSFSILRNVLDAVPLQLEKES